MPGITPVALEGRIAYTAKDDAQERIWLHEFATEQSRPLTSGPGQQYAPTFSHDGQSIAYISTATDSTELWIMDRDGGNQRQVTWYQNRTREMLVVSWTLDNQFLITTLVGAIDASGNRPHGAQMMVVSASGGQLVDYFAPYSNSLGKWSSNPSFLPNGSFVFVGNDAKTTNILLASEAGTLQRSLIETEAVMEDHPRVTPDGLFMTYTRTPNIQEPWKDRTIWLMSLTDYSTYPLPAVGSDHRQPAWSPDSQGIVFGATVDGEHRLYVYDVASGSSFPINATAHDSVRQPSWAM